MTKLTKKVALEYAMSVLNGEEVKESAFTAAEVITKLAEMVTQLDKKSSSEKPMTENQKQNVSFKEDILATLADGKARTATELLHDVPSFSDAMTNQRVSALLRQLIIDGKVKKEMVKGKAMFSLVEEE